MRATLHADREAFLEAENMSVLHRLISFAHTGSQHIIGDSFEEVHEPAYLSRTLTSRSM